MDGHPIHLNCCELKGGICKLRGFGYIFGGVSDTIRID